jgi:hypothetical protein
MTEHWQKRDSKSGDMIHEKGEFDSFLEAALKRFAPRGSLP